MCEEVIAGQLRELGQNLERLKKEQERLSEQAFAEEKERIESVVGIGPRTACALLAYAGDLSGFESHKQLTAFAGLDPTPRRSGTSLDTDGSISKKGHRKLRALLCMAAQSARKHTGRACRALHERLIERGKAKKVALVAVANKLIKQVFAVVKKGVMFDNDYYRKNVATA